MVATKLALAIGSRCASEIDTNGISQSPHEGLQVGKVLDDREGSFLVRCAMGRTESETGRCWKCKMSNCSWRRRGGTQSSVAL